MRKIHPDIGSRCPEHLKVVKSWYSVMLMSRDHFQISVALKLSNVAFKLVLPLELELDISSARVLTISGSSS
jgi:hypothetical protein